jgi:hypothetical protein
VSVRGEGAALTVVRCAHEPGNVLVGADELSVSLPESKEYVQQVVSRCLRCGRVIFGLMVFLRDQPHGRVRWRSDHELTRGLHRLPPRG